MIMFLSGGAGVGKSFLTNELIRSYKRQGKVVIALGSSALSAFNIAGQPCIVFLFGLLSRYGYA